jgi:glycosyltransferase involved in cell wall biosynthesis
MKILKIIHGYPMRYNAGSEVYSQMLCQELSKRHTVSVFTRQEDPFQEDYALQIETDIHNPAIQLYVINVATERQRYRYSHSVLDKKFATILEEYCPDIVHIGHLNHLSTSLMHEIHARKIPIVFTLHDYWLMCPRGQFMQRNSSPELWALCNGQEHHKCAVSCYIGGISGLTQQTDAEVAHWESWVKHRMEHIKKIAYLVDRFIAPSHYLYNRFVTEFGLPKNKMIYLDYGFDLSRFQK